MQFTAIFSVKKVLKALAMAFDHYLTCLIFPAWWARFPMKTSRIAQKVHLFSIDIQYFRPFTLDFPSVEPIFDDRIIA